MSTVRQRVVSAPSPSSSSTSNLFRSVESISALSFSFHDCIFDRNKNTEVTYDSLIATNKKLWEHISQNSQYANQIICLNGDRIQSMAQARRVDKVDLAQESWKALGLIEAHLNYLFPNKENVVDRYLLADAYGEKSPGFNYHTNCEDECIVDISKLSTLYGQTHKIASEHPKASIDFTFYDSNEARINNLKEYFSKPENAELLPCNVKLKLRHYSGNAVVENNNDYIQGTGQIDYLYSQGVREMAKLVTKQNEHTDANGKIKDELLGDNRWAFAIELKDKLLEKFKENRKKANKKNEINEFRF